MSSKHVERQERRDLFSSRTSEEQLLTKPTQNPKPKKTKTTIKKGRPLSFRHTGMAARIQRTSCGWQSSWTSSSHEPSLEPTLARSADLGKHSVETHFPKDRNCEICQRTNSQAPVQKTHWQSRTSCRKFWWLDDSRSQSSQWKLWISKQSSICNRGAGLGHPMDPVISVQNKNLSGNTKKLAKVLGGR